MFLAKSSPKSCMYLYSLEVQPSFIGWFLNHHLLSKGLSSSKRNHGFDTYIHQPDLPSKKPMDFDTTGLVWMIPEVLLVIVTEGWVYHSGIGRFWGSKKKHGKT